MRIFWISLGFVILLAAGFFGTSLVLQKRAAEEQGRIPLPFLYEPSDPSTEDFFNVQFGIAPPQRRYSFFDGTEFAKTERDPEFVIGVMIDNVRVARRGQMAVDEAPIVVEALAEGGVTRFLALFSSRQNFDRVGPVRSARGYFFDFIRPFHGLYVHAGGSDMVMEDLSVQQDILNIDHELDGNGTFWRDTQLVKPHNLFTGLQKLKQKLSDIDDTEGFRYLAQDAFTFSDVPIEGLPAEHIMLNFSTEPYRTEWTWKKEGEVFQRTQIDSILNVNVRNLIVMEADMWLIPGDEKGRLDMENVGSGTVLLFQDGKVKRGKWEKTSRSAPLDFFDENGLPLTFLRGKTWIAVVDDLQKVSYE